MDKKSHRRLISFFHFFASKAANPFAAKTISQTKKGLAQ